MSPLTLIIIYATLALGASFLCSILEAVLLSTTRGHVAVLEAEGSRTAALWVRYKEDPERPLTAILTLHEEVSMNSRKSSGAFGGLKLPDYGL